MKFLVKRIFYFFVDNPAAAAVLFGVILLLIIFGATNESCESRKIEKQKENVNRLTNEAQAINANLIELNIANQIKQREVNSLNANRSAAVNRTDEALENVNRARQNTNRNINAKELEEKLKNL